jgi:hypothetical protein
MTLQEYRTLMRGRTGEQIGAYVGSLWVKPGEGT